MTYHALAFKAIKQSDSSIPVMGILADARDPRSLVGIARLVSHVDFKEHPNPWTAWTADPPSNVVWRLVILRRWIQGEIIQLDHPETLDGRYVLRSGRFVELAEDAR